MGDTSPGAPGHRALCIRILHSLPWHRVCARRPPSGAWGGVGTQKRFVGCMTGGDFGVQGGSWPGSQHRSPSLGRKIGGQHRGDSQGPQAWSLETPECGRCVWVKIVTNEVAALAEATTHPDVPVPRLQSPEPPAGQHGWSRATKVQGQSRWEGLGAEDTCLCMWRGAQPRKRGTLYYRCHVKDVRSRPEREQPGSQAGGQGRTPWGWPRPP